MKWKNEMRHGEVIGADAEAGCFTLSVYHYMGCGDSWFVSCYGVFDKTWLGDMTLNEAQVIAGAKLQTKLEEALAAIIGKE